MKLIIGKDNCSWCSKAVELIESKGEYIVYQNLSTLPNNHYIKWLIREELGAKTVPFIFDVIGDYEDLEASYTRKELYGS